MDNINIYNNVQRKAEQKFKTSAWPAQDEEEWRRTNLSKYGIEKYAAGTIKKQLKSLSVAVEKNPPCDLRVIISDTGKAEAILSAEASDKGVSLSLLSGTSDSAFFSLISWSFNKMDNKTGYWNYTALDNSLLLYIPEETRLSKSLSIEYNFNESGKTSLCNLFIYAGKNSRAEIIQRFDGPGNNICISSTSTLFADAHSHIKTAVISDLSESSMLLAHRNIKLFKECTFLDFQNYNGSKLSKCRTEVVLEEENTTANLYGAFFAEGSEQFDLRTIQNHKSKNGKSKALLKSVVKEKGRTIFQGLIEVDEGGALTDAYLTNNNIILNDNARADSIPALKIRNNDVRCSHGSTTGKMNPGQIFYLTSRGLDFEKAQGLILEGFLGQVYDKLPGSFTSASLPLMKKKLTHISKRTV